MTPKQEKALGRSLDRIGDALGLIGWEVELSTQPASEGTYAEVSCTYGQKHALLHLDPHWHDLPPAKRHHVLVHELLHVVTDAPFAYLRETLPTMVGTPAWVAMNEALRMQQEHVVDQLATSLAPFVPVAEEA